MSSISFLITLAGLSQAQGLIQSQGIVVAADGQAVPGLTGVVFGGSGSFDTGSADESGRIAFRARMVGSGVTALNERGLFYGSSPADLILVIRSGDPAPGLPGVTLNGTSSSGIGGGVRASPDGEMMFGSALAGAGVGMTNDSALFVGTAGNLVLLAREGDLAPGTVGASYSSSFASISQQFTSLNRVGQALFRSTLTGGDVSGTSNNEGWFFGQPGNVQLILRKGEIMPTGQVIDSLGFVSQITQTGLVLLDAKLSTTLGTPPATTASDNSLWLINPATGAKSLILREGDPAPGTVGATFSNASNTWSIQVGICALTEGGDTIVSADLLGGDVVPGVNGAALYRVGLGGQTKLVRAGDPAIGTDGAFSFFNVSSLRFNDNGFAFQGGISGGTSTPSTDTGMWATTSSGALALVAREGDLAAGPTGGAVYDDINGQQVTGYTLMRQLLFNVNLLGGSAGSALYAWDPSNGLTAIILSGDIIETLPTVFKAITSFGGIQFSNGNNTALTLGHDGFATVRANFGDGTSANVHFNLPSFSPTTYCSAKVTSQGCTPAMGFTGTPSVSAGSGFSITCANVVQLTNGLLFYSHVGPAAYTFQGGFLCAQPPLLRTPIQNSGGGGACSGVFSIDFNAYILVGTDPGLVIGEQIWSQYWGRDVASPSTTSVSDALAFILGL